MKQNGYRFVQRKFAQGVPIPQYINVAPPAPERKVEPPRDERPVYHSGMSARSLLDIVAMQGMHKHKQPMVLLERLREDEMPTAVAPTLLVKKKMRLNAKRKNEICLRPRARVVTNCTRKRKTGEVLKVPAKKRGRVESQGQASAAEDDMPLLYLSSTTQPNSAVPEAAFKRPSTAPVIAKRKVRRNKVTLSLGKDRIVLGPSSGKNKVRRSNRKLVRIQSSDSWRPDKRLKKTASEIEKKAARRVLRRPQEDAALDKSLSPPPRTLRPVSGRNSGESPAETAKPRRYSNRSEDPPNQESNTSPTKLEPRSVRPRVANKPIKIKSTEHAKPKKKREHRLPSVVNVTLDKTVIPKVAERRLDSMNGQVNTTTTSIAEAPKVAENHPTTNKPTEIPSSSGAPKVTEDHPATDLVIPAIPTPVVWIPQEIMEEKPCLTNLDNLGSSTVSSALPVDPPAMEVQATVKDEVVDITTPAVTPTATPAVTPTATPAVRPPATPAVTPPVTPAVTPTDTPTPREWNRSPSPCPSSCYNSVQDIVTAFNNRCKILARRCRNCHGCTIVDKIIQLTKLMKPTCINSGDVYDFSSVIEDVICPTLPSLRDQSRLARSSEHESHLYLDMLPERSPHIIQITSRRNKDQQFISKARIVRRELAKNVQDQSLIEHENLLDKLLECLSVENRKNKDKHARPSTSRAPVDDPVPEVVDRFRQPSVSTRPELVGQRSEAPAKPGPVPGRPVPAPVPPAPAPAPSAPEPSKSIPRAARLTSLSAGIPEQPSGKILQAPVFRPTEEEFQDPIKYYMQIAPTAAKYGLCKIVPPSQVAPPCVLNDAMRFVVIYQYISKLYNRWGPVSREIAAIKSHLSTQSVVFSRLPLLDGNEINLSKLYHSVQRHGGATKVLQHKRWGKVAEDMKLTKLQNPERKLDHIFMRYLLPYATLSNQERQELLSRVERRWASKYQKMLQRARNPYHRQQRMLGELSSSEDEGDEGDTAGALHEAEDCIVKGRAMNLATFKKLAASAMDAHFDPSNPPTASDVEKAYWRVVLLGTEHIVANTASIDTGEEGYGFPKDPQAPYGSHPWNLKMLAKNPNNVLRFLGPVLGVTVPTLHLGMLFSTSCWHRDPHGLPWIEYMHSGPEKIWYGIPSSQSDNFRRAVSTLGPAYCQNKPIWLASDIAMIPPYVLVEHDVTLARLSQQPGEYVLVFPEAYSCSVSTGLSVTESVYFAADCWLDTVVAQFQELRNSCEPTMFSLEQLLINAGQDPNVPRHVLLAICSVMGTLISTELENRRALNARGLEITHCPNASSPPRTWNSRYQDECEYCRCNLYLSKVLGITGRKSAVCSEDAIRLLDASKYGNVDVSTLRFQSQYTTAMLETLLSDLEKRICDE